MKNLLDKIFPSLIDAITPMIHREREMCGKEKRKVARLLAALEAAYSAVITLPVDAMGTSYTDDKQPFSLRDKLLNDMAQAIAYVEMNDDN